MTAERASHAWPAALLVAPAVGIIAFTVAAPLLILFRYSLNRFDPGELMEAAFTAENYVAALGDPYYRKVMATTAAVALICTALSLGLGFPVAYHLARTRSRLKGLLVALIFIPLLVGNVVRSAGWIAIFGPGGLIDVAAAWLGLGGLVLLYSPTAVILGITAIVLPYAILVTQAVLEGIDGALIDAARSLGASPRRLLARVLVPLSLPGVTAAGVLIFVLCMNAYATPILLGGPSFKMMAPAVYDQMARGMNWPFGAALAFILMFAAIAAATSVTVFIDRRYLSRPLVAS